MYVPNYIPPPLEVPGNVTLDPWREKLAFIRRVTAWHAASALIVVAASLAPLPAVGLYQGGWLLASTIALLCLIRIATRGTPWDQRISAAVFPLVVVSLAICVAALHRSGFPVWAPLCGLSAAALYTMLCGPDFSFVGQFFLGLIVSEVGIAVMAPLTAMSSVTAAQAMAANGAYLLYYCYDLASLMSRRQHDEALAGAVDLYRDVLNLFGWVLRCVRHWRRHRIWTMPWT